MSRHFFASPEGRKMKMLPKEEKTYKYEELLKDFRPYLSIKRYEELLQELEGKTPDEKEEIIRDAMDALTVDMAYY